MARDLHRGTFYKNFKGDVDLYLGKVKLTIIMTNPFNSKAEPHIWQRTGYLVWYLGYYDKDQHWVPDVSSAYTPYGFKKRSLDSGALVPFLHNFIKYYVFSLSDCPVHEIKMTTSKPKLGIPIVQMEQKEFDHATCVEAENLPESYQTRKVEIRIEYL